MKLTPKVRFGIEAFRFVWSKLANRTFPHALQYNINFDCNKRCTYCAIYEDKRKEMSTQSAFRMIDEFAKMGTTRLSITGGEPLLRKDLGEIIDHAHKRRMLVSVHTNGSIVPKRGHLVENADFINMTLDGPREINDSQRGAGTFDAVISAAKLFRKKGIPVNLVTVITKNNCHCVSELVQMAKDLDVTLLMQPVFYSEPSHANDLEGYKQVKYEKSQIIRTIDEILELKRSGEESIILSERYYLKVKESIIKDESIMCVNGGTSFVTVSPDGRVTPCNLLVRDYKWKKGDEIGYSKAYQEMPEIKCGGCISSFIDIDYLYSFKPDVFWNYYRSYFRLFRWKNSKALNSA